MPYSQATWSDKAAVGELGTGLDAPGAAGSEANKDTPPRPGVGLVSLLLQDRRDTTIHIFWWRKHGRAASAGPSFPGRQVRTAVLPGPLPAAPMAGQHLPTGPSQDRQDGQNENPAALSRWGHGEPADPSPGPGWWPEARATGRGTNFLHPSRFGVALDPQAPGITTHWPLAGEASRLQAPRATTHFPGGPRSPGHRPVGSGSGLTPHSGRGRKSEGGASLGLGTLRLGDREESWGRHQGAASTPRTTPTQQSPSPRPPPGFWAQDSEEEEGGAGSQGRGRPSTPRRAAGWGRAVPGASRGPSKLCVDAKQGTGAGARVPETPTPLKVSAGPAPGTEGADSPSSCRTSA